MDGWMVRWVWLCVVAMEGPNDCEIDEIDRDGGKTFGAARRRGEQLISPMT